MKTLCMDCTNEITVPQDSIVGEILTCADCGADFEIISKTENTVEIKPGESVGEDWGQ